LFCGICFLFLISCPLFLFLPQITLSPAVPADPVCSLMQHLVPFVSSDRRLLSFPCLSSSFFLVISSSSSSARREISFSLPNYPPVVLNRPLGGRGEKVLLVHIDTGKAPHTQTQRDTHRWKELSVQESERGQQKERALNVLSFPDERENDYDEERGTETQSHTRTHFPFFSDGDFFLLNSLLCLSSCCSIISHPHVCSHT
jgi:hypothetical protein